VLAVRRGPSRLSPAARHARTAKLGSIRLRQPPLHAQSAQPTRTLSPAAPFVCVLRALPEMDPAQPAPRVNTNRTRGLHLAKIARRAYLLQAAECLSATLVSPTRIRCLEAWPVSAMPGLWVREMPVAPASRGNTNPPADQRPALCAPPASMPQRVPRWNAKPVKQTLILSAGAPHAFVTLALAVPCALGVRRGLSRRSRAARSVKIARGESIPRRHLRRHALSAAPTLTPWPAAWSVSAMPVSPDRMHAQRVRLARTRGAQVFQSAASVRPTRFQQSRPAQLAWTVKSTPKATLERRAVNAILGIPATIVLRARQVATRVQQAAALVWPARLARTQTKQGSRSVPSAPTMPALALLQPAASVSQGTLGTATSAQGAGPGHTSHQLDQRIVRSVRLANIQMRWRLMMLLHALIVQLGSTVPSLELTMRQYVCLARRARTTVVQAGQHRQQYAHFALLANSPASRVRQTSPPALGAPRARHPPSLARLISHHARTAQRIPLQKGLRQRVPPALPVQPHQQARRPPTLATSA